LSVDDLLTRHKESEERKVCVLRGSLFATGFLVWNGSFRSAGFLIAGGSLMPSGFLPNDGSLSFYGFLDAARSLTGLGLPFHGLPAELKGHAAWTLDKHLIKCLAEMPSVAGR
jgi:hypothetical protein